MYNCRACHGIEHGYQSYQGFWNQWTVLRRCWMNIYGGKVRSNLTPHFDPFRSCLTSNQGRLAVGTRHARGATQALFWMMSPSTSIARLCNTVLPWTSARSMCMAWRICYVWSGLMLLPSRCVRLGKFDSDRTISFVPPGC